MPVNSTTINNRLSEHQYSASTKSLNDSKATTNSEQLMSSTHHRKTLKSSSIQIVDEGPSLHQSMEIGAHSGLNRDDNRLVHSWEFKHVIPSGLNPENAFRLENSSPEPSSSFLPPQQQQDDEITIPKKVNVDDLLINTKNTKPNTNKPNHSSIEYQTTATNDFTTNNKNPPTSVVGPINTEGKQQQQPHTLILDGTTLTESSKINNQKSPTFSSNNNTSFKLPLVSKKQRDYRSKSKKPDNFDSPEQQEKVLSLIDVETAKELVNSGIVINPELSQETLQKLDFLSDKHFMAGSDLSVFKKSHHPPSLLKPKQLDDTYLRKALKSAFEVNNDSYLGVITEMADKAASNVNALAQMIPPSTIPKEFYIFSNSPIYEGLVKEGKFDFNEKGHYWEKVVFPSGNPSKRVEVYLLAKVIDAMLQMARKEDKHLENNEEYYKSIVENINKSFIVHLDSLFEVARQVFSTCVERGVIIQRIHTYFKEFFEITRTLLQGERKKSTELKKVINQYEKVVKEVSDEKLKMKQELETILTKSAAVVTENEEFKKKIGQLPQYEVVMNLMQNKKKWEEFVNDGGAESLFDDYGMEGGDKKGSTPNKRMANKQRSQNGEADSVSGNTASQLEKSFGRIMKLIWTNIKETISSTVELSGYFEHLGNGYQIRTNIDTERLQNMDSDSQLLAQNALHLLYDINGRLGEIKRIGKKHQDLLAIKQFEEAETQTENVDPNRRIIRVQLIPREDSSDDNRQVKVVFFDSRDGTKMSFSTTKEQLIRKEKEVVHLEDQLRILKQELENERTYSDKLTNELRVKNEVIMRNGLESEARQLRKERKKEEDSKKQKKKEGESTEIESNLQPVILNNIKNSSSASQEPTTTITQLHSTIIETTPKKQTPTPQSTTSKPSSGKPTQNKELRAKKKDNKSNIAAEKKASTTSSSKAVSRPSSNQVVNNNNPPPHNNESLANNDGAGSLVPAVVVNRAKTPQDNIAVQQQERVDHHTIVQHRTETNSSIAKTERTQSESRETTIRSDDGSHSSLSNDDHNRIEDDELSPANSRAQTRDNSDIESQCSDNDSDDSFETMMRERDHLSETPSSRSANLSTTTNNHTKTQKKNQQAVVVNNNNKKGTKPQTIIKNINTASPTTNTTNTRTERFENPQIVESRIVEESPRKHNVKSKVENKKSPRSNLVSSFVQTDETMFAASKTPNLDDDDEVVKPIERTPLRKLDQSEQLRAKLKPRNQRMLELYNKLREKKGEKIKPIPWLLKFMYGIYKSKLITCLSDDEKKMISVPEFIFEHLKQIYGTHKLVDDYALQLLLSVKKFARTDRRVELFSRFINEDWNVNIVNFYLKVWRGLEDSKVGPGFGQGRVEDDGSVPQFVSRVRCMSVLTGLRGEINPILSSIIKEMDPKCVTTNEEEYYKALLYAGYRGANELNPVDVWGVPVSIAKQKILKVDFFFIVCECISNYMLSTGTVELPRSENVLPQL